MTTTKIDQQTKLQPINDTAVIAALRQLEQLAGVGAIDPAGKLAHVPVDTIDALFNVLLGRRAWIPARDVDEPIAKEAETESAAVSTDAPPTSQANQAQPAAASELAGKPTKASSASASTAVTDPKSSTELTIAREDSGSSDGDLSRGPVTGRRGRAGGKA